MSTPETNREGGEKVKARKSKLRYSYQKYDDETWLLIEDQCVQFATCQTEDRAQQIIDAMNEREALIFMNKWGNKVLGCFEEFKLGGSFKNMAQFESDLRALLTRQPK